MRAGHKRSQDAVPAQETPWGEIRQQPSRTDLEPRKNTVSVGVKNISPPIYTLYINSLRTAPGARSRPGAIYGPESHAVPLLHRAHTCVRHSAKA